MVVPTDNQVTISGCPSKFSVVRTWIKVNVVELTAGALNLWLSVGQPHQYFWLSGDFFGCPGRTDNRIFERWSVVKFESKRN